MQSSFLKHLVQVKSLDSHFSVSQEGPCLTLIKDDGDNEWLEELVLGWKADGVARYSTLSSLAIVAPILICICVVQVPSQERVAPKYLMLVTFSSFWPFMEMSALVSFVFFIRTVDVFVLTFIPHDCSLNKTYGEILQFAAAVNMLDTNRCSHARFKWSSKTAHCILGLISLNN